MEKTISFYIKDFYKTKNPVSLFKAIGLIVKEGRLSEVLYGFYTFLFYSPSKVFWDKEKEKFFDHYINEHLQKKYNGFEGLIYVDFLSKKYGSKYDFDLLPEDVRFRLPSIYEGKDYLVLGEYREDSGRIFFLKNDNLQIIDFYNKIRGFKHIHCIHLEKGNNIYISTGDDTKFLDLWEIQGNKLNFKKRLKKYFAGYTSVVKINGKDYFATDFSQRPNYIIRWQDKKRFFFPKESFTMYVEYFELIDNRYIMSLNMHTSDFGGRAVTIFDTKTLRFIYSKSIEVKFKKWMVKS